MKTRSSQAVACQSLLCALSIDYLLQQQVTLYNENKNYEKYVFKVFIWYSLLLSAAAEHYKENHTNRCRGITRTIKPCTNKGCSSKSSEPKKPSND
jgi:hypothetical protein